MRRGGGRLRQIARELMGRSDGELVACVEGQIGATLAGARLALDAVAGRVSTATARAEMASIEHAGDQERGRLIGQLARALMTPVDREDLFRLSRSIDDVLDNLRDFIREFDLLAVDGCTTCGEIIEAIVDGVQVLGDAVGDLVERPEQVTRGALAAKKRGNTIRRLYQTAVASLFEEELSIDMLKRRELLRRLDVVGLRLGEAADALADGAMKRSN